MLKGLLKYSFIFIVAAWMFFLGILVGRGTSPVTFDTGDFQARLETIADNFASQQKTPEKIELKFYDVLDRPDTEPVLLSNKESRKSMTGSKNKADISRKTKDIKAKEPPPARSIPEKEPPKNALPLKLSLKKQTRKKASVQVVKKESRSLEKKAVQGSGLKKEPNATAENIPSKKKYTVQIAAFQDFKDAVSHMAALEKKGVSSYRVKAMKDGKIWYRVRAGAFETFEAAAAFKKKLEHAKIKALIIKYENKKGNQ